MIAKQRKPKYSKEFKANVATFHRWFKDNSVLPYMWEGKDFANLKYLTRKCRITKITLQEFLQGITSEWHLNNASIPLFNSHFNTLMANRSKKPTYPQYYSSKFEQTLENSELSAYWQHLTALGFKKSYSQGAGSIWIK